MKVEAMLVLAAIALAAFTLATPFEANQLYQAYEPVDVTATMSAAGRGSSSSRRSATTVTGTGNRREGCGWMTRRRFTCASQRTMS